MAPMPRLSEKKLWPRASSTPARVRFSMEGLKTNETASAKPDMVMALPNRTNSIRIISGMRISLHRSTPLCTPQMTTPMAAAIKTRCQKILASGLLNSSPKISSVMVGSYTENVLVNDR